MGKTKAFVEPERDEDKHAELEPLPDEIDAELSRADEAANKLDEKEETIKAYLEKDETLPNELLDEILSRFWTNSVFRFEAIDERKY